MADNTEQGRFIWDLVHEAEDRRDALSETTDFRQDRIDWHGSVRPRLEQEFGKAMSPGRFDVARPFHRYRSPASIGEIYS